MFSLWYHVGLILKDSLIHFRCSAPSDYFDYNLENIPKKLTWEGEGQFILCAVFLSGTWTCWQPALVVVDVSTTQKSPPPPGSSYSGLLFGGIAVGIILTFVILILWRKYGRTLRYVWNAHWWMMMHAAIDEGYALQLEHVSFHAILLLLLTVRLKYYLLVLINNCEFWTRAVQVHETY